MPNTGDHIHAINIIRIKQKADLRTSQLFYFLKNLALNFLIYSQDQIVDFIALHGVIADNVGRLFNPKAGEAQ